MAIEHPDVTNAHATGYSRSQWRSIREHEAQQAELEDGSVYDYFDDRINVDTDLFVETPQGHVILERNLQRYLEDVCGYDFNFEL